MTSGTTIELDDSRFRNVLAQLEGATGKPMQQIVREEGAKLFSTLVNLTAPKNKKQGELAVERDLHKAFIPTDPQLLADVASLSGKSVNIEQWITKSNGEHELLKWGAIGSRSDMQAWHLKMRNRRGRVVNRRNRDENKMAVTKSDFTAYLKLVKDRVGRMRAGWLPVLRALSVSATSWVSRHSNPDGDVVDHIDLPEAPTIIGINNAPGITDEKMISKLNAAMSIRAKAMAKNVQLYLAGVKRRIS